MNWTDRLKNVSVIGAAGKMGSGISLLLAQEMAFAALENPGNTYALNLVDVRDDALDGLWDYLGDQAVKIAERKINRLRKAFSDRADLVDNGEMIDAFARRLLKCVRRSKSVEMAAGSTLVFEAASEKEDLKIELFRKLAAISGPDTFFLTNTSSIPVGHLSRAAGIEGRLIGYHFYNPPAVQKLVELITPAGCREELGILAADLAERLGKTIVPSNDVAGFIGNGHFTRDGLHAIREVERLSPEMGFVPAVFAMEAVSRDFLLRPMGIFQLIDYVGIDVFQSILKVMDHFQPGAGLHSPLVDEFMDSGVKGGQTAAGTQKDGFLKYEKGKPAGVYDIGRREYAPLDPSGWTREVNDRLGGPPDPNLSWKKLQGDREKGSRLSAYFASWKGGEGWGLELARRYLKASREAGEWLVKSGVAASSEDVNRVLTLGFFHLYGPIQDYAE